MDAKYFWNGKNPLLICRTLFFAWSYLLKNKKKERSSCPFFDHFNMISNSKARLLLIKKSLLTYKCLIICVHYPRHMIFILRKCKKKTERDNKQNGFVIAIYLWLKFIHFANKIIFENSINIWKKIVKFTFPFSKSNFFLEFFCCCIYIYSRDARVSPLWLPIPLYLSIHSASFNRHIIVIVLHRNVKIEFKVFFLLIYHV